MIDTEKPIIIQPSKVTRVLGFIAVLLVLTNLAVQIMRFVNWATFLSKLLQFLSISQIMKFVEWLTNFYGFVYLFDMGAECNVPTYFSTVILLIAAFLLSIIAVFKKRRGDSYAFHWIILVIIFLYLSVDEASAIHELLSRTTQKIFSRRWFPRYAWVICGGGLVIVFALSYCGFLLHLPAKSRLLFSIAGVLYVGGAIGMEVVEGHYTRLHGTKNLPYNIIVTIEETLEMAGIILFIHALLDYISLNIKEIRFHVGKPVEHQ